MSAPCMKGYNTGTKRGFLATNLFKKVGELNMVGSYEDIFKSHDMVTNSALGG